MKKVFTLIAAAMMALGVSAESYTPTVKMTYVNQSSADTSYGEVTSASTGFNTFSNGTVGFGNTGWGVNFITYIEVDASGLPENATVTEAKLTATVSGPDRGHTFNIGYNTSAWSADLTYNTADKTATSLNSTLTTTAGRGSTGTKTGDFIITDAFKSSKKVTLLIWDTAAGGGTVSDVSASITYTTEKTSSYYVVRELDSETQIDTITYKGTIVGTEVSASETDKGNFYFDGVKYVYVSGGEQALTVDEDDTKNYIHLTFKEADKIEYTINSSLGYMLSGGTSYAGDAVKYAYPRYGTLDGSLYESSVNNREYTNTFTPTADNSVAVVNYNASNIDNIVYCNEGEYIAGLTETTAGNLPIRGSNGKGGVSTENVTVTSLPAGKYVMVVGAFTSKTSQQDLNFTVGGTAYTASSSGNLNENTSPEFTLTGETNDVVFLGSTSSADAQLDYIYIQKTGDYKYLDVESTLPDTLTYVKGTAEDEKPKLSDYVKVSTNALKTVAAFYTTAKVEAGADKATAQYTAYETEDAAKTAMSEPGLYYCFGRIVGLFSVTDISDYQEVFTDTIVVEVKEAEEEPVVSAHTWDFTKWSNVTITNLKAEAAKEEIEDMGEGKTNVKAENGAIWSDHEKAAQTVESKYCTTYAASKDNCFWFFGSANADGQLEANGQLIEELSGLTFPTETYNKARSIAIAVNYGSTSLGEYAGSSYFWLGGKNSDCFVIKNVKVGTTITMGVESHKPAEARGVKLMLDNTELKDPDGNDVAAPTVYAEQTWLVPYPASALSAKGGALSADDDDEVVDITVHNTNGCHIYFIDAEIGEPTPTAISSVEEEAEAVKTAKYFENGQIIIVKDGKKFNAAGAVLK